MSKQSHLLHLHMDKKKSLRVVDKLALVMAFLYPLSGIPQVIDAFTNGTEGISLMSWLGFTFFGAFFLTYSIVHKIKPMIITDLLWLIIDSLVVIAILKNGVSGL